MDAILGNLQSNDSEHQKTYNMFCSYWENAYTLEFDIKIPPTSIFAGDVVVSKNLHGF